MVLISNNNNNITMRRNQWVRCGPTRIHFLKVIKGAVQSSEYEQVLQPWVATGGFFIIDSFSRWPINRLPFSIHSFGKIVFCSVNHDTQAQQPKQARTPVQAFSAINGSINAIEATFIFLFAYSRLPYKLICKLAKSKECAPYFQSIMKRLVKVT